MGLNTSQHPLVFFDLEATGTDPQEARVIQIGLQRFVPTSDGTVLDETMNVLVNPKTSVPQNILELTALSAPALRQAPPFEAYLDRLGSLLEDADPDYFDWMYRTIDDLRPHIDAAIENPSPKD